MILKIWLTWFLLTAFPSAASAGVDARMFRFPDVSETQIAFVYAGDIWVVEKGGGTARRLSSPRGEELFPRFSPDGSRIAFSANYDGNMDVYVVPAAGGEPTRITHHPGSDRIVDWTPDGTQLLFASSRKSGVQRFRQLYVTSDRGGLPERLPVPYGEFGAFSPDATKLAYTPKDRGFRTWKRYRGGMAPEIWIFDLATMQASNLSNSIANDSQPMWHGNTVYFLSDRDASQRSNIWAYDLKGGRSRQVTHFKDFDITFPSIGPQEIVFQAGGRLYLLDLASEKSHEVRVDVVTDLATLRPQTKNVSSLIQGGQISPTGKRAVIEARGEIFTLPAKHGVIRKLTRNSAAAERYPAWSPDGKHIAFWTDASGEYELSLLPADGSGEARTLTSLGPGYRYQPMWSPDSKRIAFIDNNQVIHLLAVESQTASRVDEGLWMLHPALRGFEVSWSKDGRWLAYSRGLATQNSAIFLYDTKEGERHQVTSGYYDDTSPAFDPDGKYLYYLSNRTLQPVYSDLDATWIYANTTRVVAAPLRKDVPSPLAPRNDDEPEEPSSEKDDKEEAEGESSQEEEKDDSEGAQAEGQKPKDSEEEDEVEKAAPEEAEAASGLAIDIEGFESRVVVLPPEAGNYSSLRSVSGKVLYHRSPRTGSSDRNRPVVFYDLKEREEKTIIENANTYDVSADGKKLLLVEGRNWGIVDVAPKQQIKDRLATGELEAQINPREEWRQMFHDVWRMYRDYFYDPGLHGLDWEGLRKHYGALLEDAVTRWDVNFVIGELIGEVNASHTYVGGGDTEDTHQRRVGLLGVDWELADGAYRIKRIVKGAAWDAESRSPLSEPGVDVKEGDYLLAVNGTPIDVTKEPYAAFEGLAEKTVLLTVNDQPTTEGAREVLVDTMASESRLRNLEWIEANRRRVDEATDGRVGYIFVPNTGIGGQTELVRQFNSQMRKDGLIIDERFNAGGQLPDRFIELMSRRLVNRIKFRSGGVVTYPNVTHYGPKVMLINGWAGSGGDAFPYFFKSLEVGPLIGERTWGGLIGPAVGHGLVDGGGFTAPPGRIFGPDGEWFAEGHGVEPDIPVVDDPSELARGRDPQLEVAIEEVMRLIRQNPPTLPAPPPSEPRRPDD